MRLLLSRGEAFPRNETKAQHASELLIQKECLSGSERCCCVEQVIFFFYMKSQQTKLDCGPDFAHFETKWMIFFVKRTF